MTIKIHKFERKTFYVDAVHVTAENMAEVAAWCDGTIEQTQDDVDAQLTKPAYIQVKVFRALNERQTQAFPGDWVLSSSGGFKVYTQSAFDKSFQKVRTLTKEQADEAGIRPPHEPKSDKSIAEQFKSKEEKALDERINRLHGPGASAAIDAAFGDGSIFSDSNR